MPPGSAGHDYDTTILHTACHLIPDWPLELLSLTQSVALSPRGGLVTSLAGQVIEYQPQAKDRSIAKDLLLRRLRQLLPFHEGLSGEIFISARAMPQQLCQRLKISIFSDEPTFEISFKHHADIEG
jgi:hypothetical protein